MSQTETGKAAAAEERTEGTSIGSSTRDVLAGTTPLNWYRGHLYFACLGRRA